ncbi:MAG: class II aldolase/adducin family protein, partial [Gemmatimonadetes bacterium]
VLVLRNHGAVTVGATLAEAVDRMEMAELAAYAVVMAAEGAAGIDLSRVQRLTDRVGG